MAGALPAGGQHRQAGPLRLCDPSPPHPEGHYLLGRAGRACPAHGSTTGTATRWERLPGGQAPEQPGVGHVPPPHPLRLLSPLPLVRPAYVAASRYCGGGPPLCTGGSAMTLDQVIAGISPADTAAMERAKARWDSIAKPLGSLGALEEAVIRIAGMTGSAEVDISKRAVVVMCADNGVVAQGSPRPARRSPPSWRRTCPPATPACAPWPAPPGRRWCPWTSVRPSPSPGRASCSGASAEAPPT